MWIIRYFWIRIVWDVWIAAHFLCVPGRKLTWHKMQHVHRDSQIRMVLHCLWNLASKSLHTMKGEYSSSVSEVWLDQESGSLRLVLHMYSVLLYCNTAEFCQRIQRYWECLQMSSANILVCPPAMTIKIHRKKRENGVNGRVHYRH